MAKPFIITPGSYSRRAEFYHQLAQLLSAGIPIVEALRHLARNPPSRSYRAPITSLLASTSAGCGIVESLRPLNWLPEFDLSLLHAGEQSGRFDISCSLLADYYGTRARMARQFLADLAYPVALLHFAVFIFPFPNLFLTGDWRTFLSSSFGVLLPIYILVLVLVFAGQGSHGPLWRSLIDRLLNLVPVLGNARRSLALSRLCAALEGLLSAGVSITEAWETAAAASGSPRLRSAVEPWRKQIESGVTPAELVSSSGKFPPLFVSEYSTGEISGQLDRVLKHLQLYYQAEGERKMQAISQWLPRLVYLLIAVAIGVRIIGFYSGYFRMIGDAVDGF